MEQSVNIAAFTLARCGPICRATCVEKCAQCVQECVPASQWNRSHTCQHTFKHTHTHTHSCDGIARTKCRRCRGHADFVAAHVSRGVARIFGLGGGQTVPCQAEPDPASTEVVKSNFLVFYGLFEKKICPLCAGGHLPPPPSSYAPDVRVVSHQARTHVTRQITRHVKRFAS